MKQKRIFILEDDYSAARIIDLFRKHDYDVDHATNLLDTVWFLETNQYQGMYDAILLDVSINGEEFISSDGTLRRYNDKLNMNGYIYYIEQKERVLKDYEGRIAFYTGYSMLLASRVMKEDLIDISKCTIFDKSNPELVNDILTWLNDVSAIERDTVMNNDMNIIKLMDLAEVGDADANYMLGNLYHSGQSVEQDYSQSVKYFTKAATQGHVKSQHMLGECYDSGNGVEQDFEQSVKWLTKAAEQGLVNAQYDLAKHYFFGIGLKQNYSQAIEWLTKAAQQGHTEAQSSLGKYFYTGEGVEQDYEQAVMWFLKAAEQGDATAQQIIAAFYTDGIGVEQDYGQAVKWYTKAAEQGEAHSQYALGQRYFYAQRGVEQDLEQAVKWYAKASEQGHIGTNKISFEIVKMAEKTIKERICVERTEVFISYTRSDSSILRELKVSLDVLRLNYEGKIAFWYDGMIGTGQKWYDEIRLHMSKAKVAILLVSDAFLTSPFVRNEELPELLQAADDEQALIIWIPLEDSQVNDTVIKGKKGVDIRISDYQAACDPKIPLRDMNPSRRKKIYRSICQEIKKMFDIST